MFYNISSTQVRETRKIRDVSIKYDDDDDGDCDGDDDEINSLHDDKMATIILVMTCRRTNMSKTDIIIVIVISSLS